MVPVSNKSVLYSKAQLACLVSLKKSQVELGNHCLLSKVATSDLAALGLATGVLENEHHLEQGLWLRTR